MILRIHDNYVSAYIKDYIADIVSEEKNLSLIEVNEEAKQPLADAEELSNLDEFVYSLAGPITENAKVVVSLHAVILVKSIYFCDFFLTFCFTLF